MFIVTLWPACGNNYLDITLWFWAMTICVEDMRFLNYSRHGYKIVDVVVMVTFITLFPMVRINNELSSELIKLANLGRVNFSKAFLAMSLLYYSYRTIFIFFTIRHKLGKQNLRFSFIF
jgi:hypothetical protein